MVEPITAGDPDDNPLRWTSKSLAKLTAELQAMGHTVSAKVVSGLLHGLGYRLQSNRKSREGSSHPDRDAQFIYLNDQVCEDQTQGQPVISVDTKKKELVGDFKNPGREWRPQGEPERVKVHDFIVPAQGKAHYPPGTSKWNKIEHRLFSHIAMNWRGKPLVSLATIVSLIGGTTTEAGLRVRSEIDKRTYPKGVTVKDEQLARVPLWRHDFHGDWNYTIRPTAAT